MGIAACTFFGTGLSKLSITTDHRALFSEDSKYSQYISGYAETFGRSPNTLIALHCPTREDCAVLLPTLSAIAQDLQRLPEVVKVIGLHTLLHFDSSTDELVLSNYLDAACNPNCNFYSPENFVNPIGYLVNQEFDSYLLHLDVDTEMLNSEQLNSLYTRMKNSIISRWPGEEGVSMVGTFPLSIAFLDVIRSELGSHMSFSMCLLILLIFLLIGDFRLSLITIAVSTATILATLGTAGHFGLVLSTATASLPTVIFTLTLASSMHYFMYVVRLITEDPTRDIEEVALGARDTQKIPILLTAITTSVAMLSLVTVNSPPIADIGIWTAVSFLYMILFLVYLAPRAVASLPNIKRSRWQQIIQPIANNQAKRRHYPKLVTLGLISITSLFAINLYDLEVGDDFVEMFPQGSEYRTHIERFKDFDIAQNTIQISIDSGSSGGIFDPKFIDAVSRLQEFSATQKYVRKTLSVIDQLEVASPHLLNKALPDLNEDQLSQLLFSLQLFDTTESTYASFVDPSFQYVSLQLLLDDLPSTRITHLEETLANWASSEIENPVYITGESLQLAHLSTDNLPRMIVSISISLAIGAIFLGFFFRSKVIGGLLLITTVAPVLIGLGVWALFNDEIGLALTLIVAVCVGVVIDDAIHVIYRFVDGRDRLHLDSFEAGSFSVQRVGTAVISTTLILSIGFGSLVMSEFSLNSSFGSVTALILLIALVIDLLILPSLLSILYKERVKLGNELPSYHEKN